LAKIIDLSPSKIFVCFLENLIWDQKLPVKFNSKTLNMEQGVDNFSQSPSNFPATQNTIDNPNDNTTKEPRSSNKVYIPDLLKNFKFSPKKHLNLFQSHRH
jgi:hypothetical protein